MRYKHASGPVTVDMENELVRMIKAANGREELLAKDILEVMSEARSNPDGFRAAKDRLIELSSDY